MSKSKRKPENTLGGIGKFNQVEDFPFLFFSNVSPGKNKRIFCVTLGDSGAKIKLMKKT